MDDAPDAVREWHNGEYTISTDRQRLNLNVIHGFISERSYWAQGIPRAVMGRAIRHSLNFGVYRGNEQVGFARVITDYATHAYLCDVFISEEYRGRGLSKWLVATMLAHPALQGLRRWFLLTRDAQELYRQFGFSESPDIVRKYMEIRDPDVYQKKE